MQLKIRRSQRLGGVLGNTAIFCVEARAEFTHEEQFNIRKYKLGGKIVYNSKTFEKHTVAVAAGPGRTDFDITTGAGLGRAAGGIAKHAFHALAAHMSLVITIDSLQQGQRIECKDLDEVLAAEEALHNSCQAIRTYLDLAATFDGREVVVDYSEEVPAKSEGTPSPANAAPPIDPGPAPIAGPAPETYVEPLPMPALPQPAFGRSDLDRLLDRFVYWFNSKTTAQKVGIIVGAVAVLLILGSML
jgi:hypothetical protein